MHEFGSSRPDAYPGTGSQHVELSPEDARYLREELGTIEHLSSGLAEFGDGLEAGRSRTYFGGSINTSYRNDTEAMIGAAAEFAERMWTGEINPQSIGAREVDIPQGLRIKGVGDVQTDPIGFVKVEQAPKGLLASVGAIDPITKALRLLPITPET